MSDQTGGFPNAELDAELEARGITPSEVARLMLATTKQGEPTPSEPPEPALPLPPAAPFQDDEIPPEPPVPDGELPGEVLAAWSTSEESLSVAHTMIDKWGLERFLNSELHRQAKYEATRAARMAPIQKAFVEAQRKKEKERKR